MATKKAAVSLGKEPEADGLRFEQTTATKERRPVYGNAADEFHGYNFGCDGLMTPDDAGKYLAVSGRQLDRLAAASKIRKGLMPSGIRRFCRRSVELFAQSLEQ